MEDVVDVVVDVEDGLGGRCFEVGEMVGYFDFGGG